MRSPKLLLSTLSQRHWISSQWLLVAIVFSVVLLQTWAANGLIKANTELRGILSEAHTAATSLERQLGYGGLIHNFKNYVLRPEEVNYRESALLNAEQALVLLDRLSTSAENIEINANLSNTREMLGIYMSGLARVQQLANSGLTTQAIDRLVRVDDEAALQEVQLVLTELDAAVDSRLARLQRRETLISLTGTIATALLGLLLLTIIVRRQKKHAKALSAVAMHLSDSNTHLSRANESLSQFAGIVSHDLKTPVRYIFMFNQLIEENKNDASVIEQQVDRIDTQVRKMDSIIDSLLDFTKFGYSQPKSDVLDAVGLFADIKQELQTDFTKHNALVEFDSDSETQIFADPELLSRVLHNLIDNSLKYCNPDTQIHIVVNASNDGSQTLFSVTDNGIGIDARFANSIFDPMTRLHGENSAYQGVGMGLWLVKSIVESHGGLVWLDTDITQGTCITFSIPLTQHREAA